jgi:sorting nexin-8
VDKIRKLTQDLPEVNLAVSLHAPNQTMRTSIVPSAKRYPIEDLIDALDNHMMTFASKQRHRHLSSSNENPQNGEYVAHETKEVYTMEERTRESTRRRAMVEYVMLDGPTSSIEAAHQLGKLCEGRQLVVNLIPYNQTDVKDQLRCPSEDHMQEFRNIVASYGSFCTIRRTMGADIDSACGQLVTLENKRSKVRRSTDIEDVGTSQLAQKHLSSHDNESMNPNTVPSTKGGNTATTSAQAVDISSISEELTTDLEPLINVLVYATMVSAVCFVATTYLYLQGRRP